MISVTYDPSFIGYKVNLIGEANLLIKVKQEGVHQNACHAEKSVTNIPAVQVAAMNQCPKVSDSPSRKQKGLLRGPADVDKENQPAKVTRHAQVLVVRSEDVSDTDEDLETQPVPVKRSTPRMPYGSSLDRSNNSVALLTTAHDGKLCNDQVTAMKLRQERQDIPGIKREPSWC